MSGYDMKKYASSLDLLTKRMYGKTMPKWNSLYTEEEVPGSVYVDTLDPSIEGVRDQSTILQVNGGLKQQERMIYDKRRSLDRALIYSYQGANIRKIAGDGGFEAPVRALINSNKLKQDYDDKIISVGYEHDFQCGDVFEWMDTNTFWLIYLQELTELAYFRADIRKCSHIITYEDADGVHTSHAAIRGPVETKINSVQKHGIIVDNPNYSLNILLPKTKSNLEFFRRYNKFYLSEAEEGAPQVCWRVEAVNWISMPGIIEIAAVEYYSNTMEDKNILEKEEIGTIETKPITPTEGEQNLEPAIKGEDSILPKKKYKYTVEAGLTGEWSVLPGVPVKIKNSQDSPQECEITWVSGFSGSFDLSFGKIKKHITVKSLF